MEKSKNYGFNLPNSENQDELADINPISENFSLADEIIKEISDEIKKVSEVDDFFSYSSERPIQNKVISNNVANALKGTASGSVVSLNDVSPLEHEIGVKLSAEQTVTYVCDLTVNGVDYNFISGDGDYTISSVAEDISEDGGMVYFTDGSYCDCWWGSNFEYIPSIGNVIRYGGNEEIFLVDGVAIDDFSAVTLTKSGKNLIDQENFVDSSIDYGRINACVKNENGNFYIEKTENTESHFSSVASVFVPANISFTVSFNLVGYDMNKEDGSAVNQIGLQIFYADGTAEYMGSARTITTTGRRKLATLNKAKAVTGLRIYVMPEPVLGSFIEFNKFQVEIGSSDTEYEPYKGTETYTPNTDGSVGGVTSLYPTTTLLTDTEGITIEAEYNRDLNKAFEEIYQAIATMGAAAVAIPEEV